MSEARRRGFVVGIARPAEAEANFLYAALADLIADHADAALESMVEPLRSALAVSLLRATPDGRPLDPRIVAAAGLAAIRHVARDRPLLLAVDDIQWLDRTSAGVLSFVLRRLTSERVCFLGSLRTPVSTVPLGLDRPPLSERLTRLSIEPLSFGAIHLLLLRSLSRPVSRSTARRIHEATEGNPLFALELGHALERRGTDPHPNEPLPVPNEMLLVDRFAELSSSARQVLLVVAASAGPTIELVHRVIQDRERADAALGEAVSARILRLDRDRVSFVHPLLASAAYGRAVGEERHSLHLRLASVVADPVERGRHLALGTVAPDPEVASALDAAATMALGRAAPETAADLQQRAAELTPPTAKGDIVRRILEAATSRMLAGEPLGARALLRDAASRADPGSQRAEVLRRLGLLLTMLGEPAEGVTSLERALVEAGEDETLRAAIEVNSFWPRRNAGDLEGAVRAAESGLAAAEASEDRATASMALAHVAIGRVLSGKPVDDEMIRRAEELGLPPPGTEEAETVAGTWAAVLRRVDRLDESRERFRSIFEQATRDGDLFWPNRYRWHLVELELAAGNWAEAAAVLAEDRAAAELLDMDESGWRYAHALVAAYRGDAEEALTTSIDQLAEARQRGELWLVPLFTAVLGFVELSLERYPEADPHLRPMARQAIDDPLCSVDVLRALPDAIECFLHLGDLETAERTVERLQTYADSSERPWARATVARCRGLVLAAKGDVDGAIPALEAALAEHDRLPMPFERARTELVAGEVFRRARRWRAARTHLERACSTFERLGAPPWAARAARELARVRPQPSATDLSPTEERVARMAAAGMSNREIADILFLSLKTIESNLTRVYLKLGVQRRSALAGRLEPSELRGTPTTR